MSHSSRKDGPRPRVTKAFLVLLALTTLTACVERHPDEYFSCWETKITALGDCTNDTADAW